MTSVNGQIFHVHKLEDSILLSIFSKLIYRFNAIQLQFQQATCEKKEVPVGRHHWLVTQQLGTKLPQLTATLGLV